MEHEIAYTVSGSNLFADGELPDAAALYVKSRLCVAIRDEMKKQGLTQSELAAKSGVHQRRISKICGKNTEGISIDIILRVVEALGYDVEPVLKKRRGKELCMSMRGHLSVRIPFRQKQSCVGNGRRFWRERVCN